MRYFFPRPVNFNTNDLALVEEKKINSSEIYLWNIDDGNEEVVKLFLISLFLSFYKEKIHIDFLGSFWYKLVRVFSPAASSVTK